MKERIREIVKSSKDEEDLVDKLSDFVSDQLWHATVED